MSLNQQVFLAVDDCSLQQNVGQTVLLRFRLRSSQSLHHIKLSMLPGGSSPVMVSPAECERLDAEKDTRLLLEFHAPDQPGQRAFHVTLTGYLDAAAALKPFYLKSSEPLSLTLTDPSRLPQPEIHVGGGAILDDTKISGGVKIKIGHDAILSGMAIGETVVKGQAKENWQPIELYQPDIPPGIRPHVDLEMLAGNWDQFTASNPAKVVEVAFMDRWFQKVLDSARAGDPYHLKVSLLKTGYLTLVAQGTSGQFYMLYPHSKLPGKDVGPLEAGTYTLPGFGSALYDTSRVPPEGREIAFGNPVGVERVLAILTPDPLVNNDFEFFSGCSQYVIQEIILRAARMHWNRIDLVQIAIIE